MDNLKPCGCGATPETLLISDGSTFRWRYISGSCCGEWEHECRVPTIGDKATPEGVRQACIDAWNELPRVNSFARIADLEAQLTAANARVEGLECHWREVDEKPPSNQPILIEMKMLNGETRYDMTMGDLLDNALYVTRWAPAPPEQEKE